MSCLINQGYSLGCSTVGGVEKVWIGTYSANAAYAYDADNVITAVTSGVTVYLMEQDIEFSFLNQEGQFSRESGTVFYESVLGLKFLELDKDLRNLAVALGRAPIFAVVKSNSGEYFALGVETAGRATTGSLSLGQAFGDMNGFMLEVTFRSANGAFLIDPALLGTSLPIG